VVPVPTGATCAVRFVTTVSDKCNNARVPPAVVNVWVQDSGPGEQNIVVVVVVGFIFFLRFF
jgi:hypothetical protein